MKQKIDDILTRYAYGVEIKTSDSILKLLGREKDCGHGMIMIPLSHEDAIKEIMKLINTEVKP
jgi:hypothetical protein